MVKFKMESAIQLISLSKYFINDLSLEILTYLYGSREYDRAKKIVNELIQEATIDTPLPKRVIVSKLYSYITWREDIPYNNSISDEKLSALFQTKTLDLYSLLEEIADSVSVRQIIKMFRPPIPLEKTLEFLYQRYNQPLLRGYPKLSQLIASHLLANPKDFVRRDFSRSGIIRHPVNVEDNLRYWQAILLPKDFERINSNRDKFNLL